MGREALRGAPPGDGALQRHRERVARVAAAGREDLWQRLMERLDGGLLLEQSEALGDFRQAARDLEDHLVPGVAERRDWDRFLTFSLQALTLRGLATDLDSGPLMETLARERPELAATFVEQLADPGRRARARAVLVAATPAEGLEAHQDLLVEELEAAAPGPGGEAGPWAAVLAGVAHRLGPGLKASWRRWLPRLDGNPEAAARVEAALVRSLLAAGDLASPTLRWCLGRLDLERPGAPPPDRLVPAPLPPALERDPWPFLEGLWRPGGAGGGGEGEVGDGNAAGHRGDGGPAGGWRLVLAILAARSASIRGGAVEAAEWLLRHRPAGGWSAGEILAGAHLWPRLEVRHLDVLVPPGGDPRARAALERVLLEADPSGPVAGPSAATVDRLVGDRWGGAAAWLHAELGRQWVLRRYRSRREDDRLARALDRLRRLDFRVPVEDLGLALDLVAVRRPARLRRWLERALRAHATGAPTLLHLARHGRSPELLAELHRRAERWAAEVVADGPSGFALRADLLAVLTARLCVQRRDLSALEEAVPRLLAGEEDRVRREVATALVAAGLPARARDAAATIRSPGERLRVRVALLAARTGGEALTLEELYGAAAEPTAVLEELAALEPLQGMAGGEAPAVDDPVRRAVALLDLARRRLEEQCLLYEPRDQDRGAALAPLQGELTGLDSEARVVALAPELAEVGSHAGALAAILEHLEGLRLVLGAGEVGERLRRDALAGLLGRCEERFLGGEGEAPLVPLSPRRRRAALRTFLRRALRLPVDRPEGRLDLELRRRWTAALPLLVALDEARRARPPRGLVGRLLASRSLPLRRRPLPWEPYLPPELARAPEVELCRADPESRRRRAWEVRATATPVSAAEGEALAWLLAREEPWLACEVVRRIAPGDARAAVARRLVASAWLPPAEAARLAESVPPGARGELRLAREVARQGAWREAGSSWLPSLAVHAARGGFETGDPDRERLRRRLWELDDDPPLIYLARGVVDAFQRDDPDAARQGLRLFLNAWLRPRRGRGSATRAAERTARARRAADRSRHLGRPPGGADGAGGEGVTPSAALPRSGRPSPAS